MTTRTGFKRFTTGLLSGFLWKL